MNSISQVDGFANRIRLRTAACLACFLAAVFFTRTAPAQAANSAPPSAVPPAGIWGLDFSPDGKWLAAATNARGHGGPIVIWRVEDWQPHVIRMEPTGGLDVAFSPNGKLLAYSTRSPQVGLIDVTSGKLVRTIKALGTNQGTIFGVAFAADGKSLLTSGTGSAIREWNLADGSLKRTFDGRSGQVDGIAVSPDGALLLAGGEHESQLWDMRTGKPIQVFNPENFLVRRVRFSPDGQFFLTSSWGIGKTRIRETRTRQLRVVLPSGSNSAAITRDNRLLATTGQGTTAEIYRLHLAPATADQVQRIRRLIEQLDDDDYAVRTAAAREIAQIGLVAEPLLREARNATSAEVRMRARELRKRVMSPEPIAELGGHRGNLEVVCFSPDDKLLATGGRGGDVKIWTVPELNELLTLTAPPTE